MNALFLSSRSLDAATITASSAEGALAGANVQTIDPTEVWRSTGATAENLVIDFGDPVLIDSVIAVGVNWSEDATIRLRLADTEANLTAAPGFDSGAVSAWPASSVPPSDWLYPLSLLIADNETAYRFARLDIADAANPDGYLEIGRLFMGAGFVPTFNVDINPVVGLVSADEAERTPFNHTIGDQRGYQSRVMTVPMSAINENDMRDDLFELQRYCGLALDFAFCLDPDATTSFHLYAMQARFVSLAAFQKQPVWSDVSQLWQTSLSLEEIN